MSSARTAGQGPAVGLLTRAPQPGLAKTRLAAAIGDQAAARLAEAFLLDVASVVRGGGWRPTLFVEPGAAVSEVATLVGISDARPQAEGSIGRRMLAAATTLEGEGYAPVILVGSDIPTLRPSHLGEALSALERIDVVFGPAGDGGYFLVGMRRVAPAIFDDAAVPWGRDGVLAAAERLAEREGLRTARISAEHDVDTPADLERLRARCAALAREGQAPAYTAAALAAIRPLLSAEPRGPRRREERNE